MDGSVANIVSRNLHYRLIESYLYLYMQLGRVSMCLTTLDRRPRGGSSSDSDVIWGFLKKKYPVRVLELHLDAPG